MSEHNLKPEEVLARFDAEDQEDGSCDADFVPRSQLAEALRAAVAKCRELEADLLNVTSLLR